MKLSKLLLLVLVGCVGMSELHASSEQQNLFNNSDNSTKEGISVCFTGSDENKAKIGIRVLTHIASNMKEGDVNRLQFITLSHVNEVEPATHTSDEWSFSIWKKDAVKDKQPYVFNKEECEQHSVRLSKKASAEDKWKAVRAIFQGIEDGTIDPNSIRSVSEMIDVDSTNYHVEADVFHFNKIKKSAVLSSSPEPTRRLWPWIVGTPVVTGIGFAGSYGAAQYGYPKAWNGIKRVGAGISDALNIDMQGFTSQSKETVSEAWQQMKPELSNAWNATVNITSPIFSHPATPALLTAVFIAGSAYIGNKTLYNNIHNNSSPNRHTFDTCLQFFSCRSKLAACSSLVGLGTVAGTAWTLKNLGHDLSSTPVVLGATATGAIVGGGIYAWLNKKEANARACA